MYEIIENADFYAYMAALFQDIATILILRFRSARLGDFLMSLCGVSIWIMEDFTRLGNSVWILLTIL